MPKAYDVRHNYYADLDLPTTATCEEVKKQYRKLALQYHPDRNAGKEEEYIPKFQAIQAAHEVLGEQGEKTRYDSDRRKAGLYPMGGSGGGGGGGTRGNPYQATSAYPPPPRRTQPGTYQRPQATGADRFANFGRPAPTAKRADPAAERQNAFKAWQNMNNAQDRQQQSRYAQASAQAQAKPASPRRPAPPPRTDPKFPTDEKIRAGFNYREAPHSTFADGAEERQSAWAAFQNSRGSANTPGVQRSNTNKTPKKQGFDPNVPGSDEGMAPDSQYAHRHKSADFGRPGAAPPPPPRPSRPESPVSPRPQRPHADPLRPFKSRTHTAEEDAPYSEGNRVRTPYSSFSGEKTDFGGDMRRSHSTRDAFKLNPESKESRARSNSPLGRSTSSKGGGEGQQSPPRHSFSVGGSSSTSSNSSEDESADAPKASVPPQDRPKIVPSRPSRRFRASGNPASFGGNGTSEGEMKEKSTSNIFSFPVPPAMLSPSPPPNTKTRSEESINTKFSSDGWTGTFSGSTDYFAPPQATSRRGSPSLRGGPHPRPWATASRPGNAAQSPSETSMPPPPPPFTTPQGSTFSDPPSAASDNKFSKEEWEQTFKDATWTMPSSPAKGGARVKTASRKNSRATRPPSAATGTAANPQVVDEEDDQTIDPRSTGNNFPMDQNANLHEPDAMDIDNTPPAAEQSHAEQLKEPRLVSVPPSAWRQSQQQHVSNGHNRTTSSGSSNAPLRTNLNDLANVAPFTHGTDGSGLQNLSSMSETLPFTSQAANTLPTNPQKPQVLATPTVPVPPNAPTRLSKQTWHQYAQEVAAYLIAFNKFNSEMLQYFQIRNQQDAARMQTGMAWLEATGDSVAGGGFGSYAREIKEHERMREVWNMGCEKQAEAVKEFDDVRGRMRRLAAAGSIPDQ